MQAAFAFSKIGAVLFSGFFDLYRQHLTCALGFCYCFLCISTSRRSNSKYVISKRCVADFLAVRWLSSYRQCQALLQAFLMSSNLRPLLHSSNLSRFKRSLQLSSNLNTRLDPARLLLFPRIIYAGSHNSLLSHAKMPQFWSVFVQCFVFSNRFPVFSVANTLLAP